MPVSILRWQREPHAARRGRAARARGPRAGVETVGVSAVREHAVEVADAERAEHENRHAHAGLAQRDAFLDVGAREHRRAGGLERERRPRAAPWP